MRLFFRALVLSLVLLLCACRFMKTPEGALYGSFGTDTTMDGLSYKSSQSGPTTRETSIGVKKINSDARALDTIDKVLDRTRP